MPYRACIFDLDGTLADTLASIAGFVNDTLAVFSLPPIPVEEYRMLVGNGADLLVRRAIARAGGHFTEEQVRAFRAEYDRRYAAEPLRQVTVYPGLRALLAQLKQKNIRLGVVSNKPDDMTNCIVRALYGDLPDQVRGQREGVPVKPDPAAILAMAADFFLAPAQVLYIGDSAVDMDAARNAGMDGCGVLWGFRTREELEAHGAICLAADAAALRDIILSAGR